MVEVLLGVEESAFRAIIITLLSTVVVGIRSGYFATRVVGGSGSVLVLATIVLRVVLHLQPLQVLEIYTWVLSLVLRVLGLKILSLVVNSLEYFILILLLFSMLVEALVLLSLGLGGESLAPSFSPSAPPFILHLLRALLR